MDETTRQLKLDTLYISCMLIGGKGHYAFNQSFFFLNLI